MIQSTGKFNCVTTYHIMQYNRLLYNYLNNLEQKAKTKLNEYLIAHNGKNRGIDRLQMKADLPLEYAFLIDDGYVFNDLNENNIDRFKEICKKIQFVEGKDKKFLAKNPWDFANFMFIKKQFPAAKFVFIHRHPLPFLNSSLKALRTLTEERTVYSDVISPMAKKLAENPILNLLSKVLLFRYFPVALPLIVEHHVRQAHYFLNNIDKLDEDDFINVRYEDLCARPVETMAGIIDFLNLEENNINRFKRFIKPRHLSISTDVKQVQDYIYQRLKEYFSYFKYHQHTF